MAMTPAEKAVGSYKTTGLTPSKGTIAAGGYTVLGNIVLVNIRISGLTLAVNEDVSISGLPNPLPVSGNANYVSLSSPTRLNVGYISSSGVLHFATSDAYTNTTILLACVYAAAI